MKELNRREFLTLSGAAVVALSLAGCGGGSSAPATPKEAKVLEAINKYRGSLPPLTLDSGLDPAMDIAVKMAKGEMKATGEDADAYAEARAAYKNYFAPIGLYYNEDNSGYVHPVLVYSDNAEEIALNLNNHLAETDKASLRLPAVTLVNIRTFEFNGTTYWIALIA